jgi:two-component system sensor histidine kinase KdpD
VVDDLLDQSGDIDVYVIHGEEEKGNHVPRGDSTAPPNLLPYFLAVGLIALAGCLAGFLHVLHVTDAEANTVMLFLAAVAWVASWHGRGPAIVGSVLAVLVFDFFFVPPYYTFAVADTQYVVTFLVMLVIGLAISTLTSRLREQIESTRHRERRTTALYELGKQLSSLYGQVFLVGAAGVRIAEMINGEVAIYLGRDSGAPELVFGHESSIAGHPVSVAVAQWVLQHDQMAGGGTNTLPNAVALFLPLTGSQRTHGAIAVRVEDATRLLAPEVRRLLEACANQLALALERDQLTIDAANARIQAEAEQVRSSLLSSVSHDLKTPLAAIAGASSSLLESATLSEETRRQLLETVAEEADRLNRLLENLLQISKLEVGAAPPNRQWHVLEELVGTALHRTERQLAHHKVAVHLPPQLPLLFVDGLLLEQVFVNLLENAARFTPEGSEVAIRAAIDGTSLRLAISDEGPGIPPGMEESIFEKFFRASPNADGGRGSGLGLAICRAIILAHAGTITAFNRPQGGAEFVIRLPLAVDAPQIPLE